MGLPDNESQRFKGLQGLFNKSGGLSYHYQALRYKNSLWKNYNKSICGWLKEWKQGGRRLVIIGPSGGYSLNSKFLGRYERIYCVDPDPLAQKIFCRRFSNHVVSWDYQNYFLNRQGEFEINLLNDFFNHHKDADFLFTNILGQLALIYPRAAYIDRSRKNLSNNFKGWLIHFRNLLSAYNFASFHDLYSTKYKPDRLVQEISIGQGDLDLKTLVSSFYDSSKRQSLTFADHHTSVLFKEFPRKIIYWKRTKKNYHFIECVKRDNWPQV